MREQIREGIAEVLSKELTLNQFTHEHCPPNRDGNDCANPDVKHKRCRDCWQGFVDELNLKLRQKMDSQGVVIKVDKDNRYLLAEFYTSKMPTAVDNPDIEYGFYESLLETPVAE